MASRDKSSSKTPTTAQKGGNIKQNQQAQQKQKQPQQQTKASAVRTKKQTANDELKQKVKQIQNVVPEWPTDDVIRVLRECHGSAEMALDKILAGDAGHPGEEWQPAKKKKAEKSVQETPKASQGPRGRGGPRGPSENGHRAGGAGRPDGRGDRRPDNRPLNPPGSGSFAGQKGAVPQQRLGAQPGSQHPYPGAQGQQGVVADGGIDSNLSPSVEGGLLATPSAVPPQLPGSAAAVINGGPQQPTAAQRLAAAQRAGAPIGSGPRANGPTAAQIVQAQAKPPSEQLTAAQVLQGRPQTTQADNKPVAQQQTTQQPRPQQGAAPTAAQVAARKPVTAIQPKGPITAQPVAQQQPVASSAQPAQGVASVIPQQPVQAAVAQPQVPTQLQTTLLPTQTAAPQTSAAATPAASTQQPSSPQGATKAYQQFGNGSKGSGRGTRPASTQWQPKTQQPSQKQTQPSSPPQSVLSSPSQSISTSLQSSSAQSITTAKEAPQQAAQQAAAAALGAIGQSVPVILPSGLFPSDREEQSIQLQFGNFGLTPANALKEEAVVPITPAETKQQQTSAAVQPSAAAASTVASAPAPVGRPSPVSVSSAAAPSAAPVSASQSSQQTSTARPAALKEPKPEPVQSLSDSNDQNPNLPRKAASGGARAGEKKAAAAAHHHQQQQQQQYQQQQQQQYQQQQQQHVSQQQMRGLAPPGAAAAIPAAMPAAAEGYDMSAFSAPLPYPTPFWAPYPMDPMAPETQQMFYDYQPTTAYQRTGAPVSPEPKYGSGSSSSQSYRDSGKYSQQPGSQGGAEDQHSGPSPRGSSSGQPPQSQSPPPMQQQPPHHFGIPAGSQYPAHLYGYHPYPYSYPSPSFSQYQYPPQRIPSHYKTPHYPSNSSYPVSPPGSSSLGASGYPEDDYSKYGMQGHLSQSFYETPAHISPTMGMKNPHQTGLSSSSSKSQQQQASQMGAYSQGSDLSGVGASSYKSLGITDYSSQDMSRTSPSSFYSPQFSQQGQYQQQYGFVPQHGAHHYQPQHGQSPHQSQSGQSSGSAQNPQYS